MAHDNREALNRYLDDLAHGTAASENDLDPELLATVRWFRDLGAGPMPDPAFRTRLERNLMSHTFAPTASVPHRVFPLVPLGRVWGRASPMARPPRGMPRWASSLVAAAVLLLALGLAYLYGPLRPDPDRPRSIPAAVVQVATPGTSEATPTPTPFPMTDHPIIGMWQFDIETRQPGIDLAYFDFTKDGTFVGAGERGDWVSFGNWRATGARTAELFYVLQGIPPQDVFAPDYVPVGNVFEPDMITLRLSLQIDAAGNRVTAEGEGTIYNQDGTVANEFDGGDARMIGTRMEVVVPTGQTPTPTS